MHWFTIDDPSWQRFPIWLRSLGVSREGGEVYVAAAIAGNEQEVLFQSMRENIATAKNHEHVYVPAQWLSRRYPDAKDTCEVLMKLASMHVAPAPQQSDETTPKSILQSLSLRYPLTPEKGVNFALDAAEQAHKEFGLVLNFSPQSLQIADDLIDRARNANTPRESIAEYLFGLGCYLGQVMVKNAGCAWVDSHGSELQAHTDFPIVLRLRDGTHAQPISKAFKRFNNGEEDSLVDFYNVFSRGAFFLSKG